MAESEITKAQALERVDYFLSILTAGGAKIVADDARIIIVLPYGTRHILSVTPEEITLATLLGVLPQRRENADISK